MIVIVGNIPYFKAITTDDTAGVVGRPATFFPFNGVSTTNHPGHYIKASDIVRLPLSKRFPELILDFIKAYQNHDKSKQGGTQYYLDDLGRFGNFECMIISMLLGGGIWELDQGKCLQNFILKYFPSYVKEIKNQHSASVNHIRNIVTAENKLKLNSMPTACSYQPEVFNLVESQRNKYSFFPSKNEAVENSKTINQFLAEKNIPADRIDNEDVSHFVITHLPRPEEVNVDIDAFLNEYPWAALKLNSCSLS